MNKNILSEKVQKYLNENLEIKIADFALKKSPFEDVSIKDLVQQLQGKKIAQKKLPFLLENNNIYFPIHLSLEQCSNQLVAEFKSKLFSGENAADLTGGFGIDAFFMSQKFKKFCFVEQNQKLNEIVQNNFKEMNIKNVDFYIDSAENFLEKNEVIFDWIYLDPDRRNNNNKNVLIDDLSPNLYLIKEKLLEKSKNIYIKLSPLIDLKSLIYELKNIQNIYLISHKNELKEVSIHLMQKENNNPKINCINLETNQPEFNFEYQTEQNSEVLGYENVQKYIYIPNSSVMKSCGYKTLSNQFKIKKLDANTHIYTSENVINFPGNIYEVIDYNVDTKKINKIKSNIISKNYPLQAPEIKSKYKIKDGSNEYLLFTKVQKKYIVLRLKKYVLD